jgi:VanZ family protein
MSVSVYAAALIVVTLMPWNHPGRTVPRIDMALHFVAWTVLAFLTAIAWAKSRPPIGAAALAALAAICFGALLEALQPLTGRTAEALDLAADALGAAIGASVAALAAWSGQRMAQRRGNPG